MTLKLCQDCWSEGRKKLKKGRAQGKLAAKDGVEESSATTDRIQEDLFLAVKDAVNSASRRAGRRETTVEVALPAMMWDSVRGWIQKSEGHGMVRLTAFTREDDLCKFGLRRWSGPLL